MRSRANSNGVNLVSSTATTFIYMIFIFSNEKGGGLLWGWYLGITGWHSNLDHPALVNEHWFWAPVEEIFFWRMPFKFILHSCLVWLGKAEANQHSMPKWDSWVGKGQILCTAEDKFLSLVDTWLLSQQVDLEVNHDQLVQKYCCVTMTMTQPFNFNLNSTQRRVFYSNKNPTAFELHSRVL